MDAILHSSYTGADRVARRMNLALIARKLARIGARLPTAVNREWPGLRHVKMWLLRHVVGGSVSRDGFVLEVDPTDSLRLAMGDDHEPCLVDLLPRLLRKGDLAVDAGAHIGYLSLHMSRCVGETGRVIAFEPDPDNYRLLQYNLSRNRCSNVRAVPAGLWNAVGRGRLYRCHHHHGDHRVWDSGGGRSSVPIDLTTLDRELSGDNGRLRLVKLDVQGAELEVLRGMEQLFRRSQMPVLVLELWPRGLRGCGSEPRDLVNLLVGHGYALSLLAEDGSAPTAVDPVALLRRHDPADLMGRLLARFRRRDEVDLLCAPPDVVV